MLPIQTTIRFLFTFLSHIKVQKNQVNKERENIMKCMDNKIYFNKFIIPPMETHISYVYQDIMMMIIILRGHPYKLFVIHYTYMHCQEKKGVVKLDFLCPTLHYYTHTKQPIFNLTFIQT